MFKLSTWRQKISFGLTVLLVLSFIQTQNQKAQAATISLIQSASTSASGNANTLTRAFTSANTAGNLIVVSISFSSTGGTTWSCTDSKSNTYATATTYNDTRHNQILGICYAANIKAGSNTVTLNLGGISHTSRAMTVQEYSGVATVSPLDKTATNFGTATTVSNAVTSTAVTPSINGELIFGTALDDTSTTTINAGSGFTRRQFVASNHASEDMTQTVAGSVAATFTFTTAHDYIAQIATFKPFIDTQAPSVPTGLTASGISTTQINLAWTASTDNVAVTGYNIFRNGTQIGTSPTNSFSDTGLTASTSYSYTVSAFDASANTSGLSTPVSGSTTVPFNFSLTNSGDKSTNQGGSVTNTITATAQGAPSTVPNIQDSFTATSGSLASHAPEIGSTWVTTQGAINLVNNTVRSGSFFSENLGYNSTSIPSDSDISMDIVWNNCVSDSDSVGIFRTNNTAVPRIGMYEARYELNNGAGRWILRTWSGGNPTVLGTFSQPCVAGQTHNLKLGKSGSSLTMYVDGTTLITATDSTQANTNNAGIVLASSGNTDRVFGDNFLVTPRGPSVSLIAHTAQGSVNQNGFTTTGIDTSGANLIVVTVVSSTASVSVTDSKSNTWTLATADTAINGTRMYYAWNASVGTNHTFTVTGTGSSPAVLVSAYSGIQTSSNPLDKTNHNGGLFGSPIQAGSVTPATNGQLIVAADNTQGSTSNELSINSSFGITDQIPNASTQHFGGGMAYIVQSVAGAINPSWTDTSNGSYGAVIATFKANTSSSVSFSVSGLPANASGSFSPTSCSFNCSTTLTITTQSNTPVGSSVITVTGMSSGTPSTTTFNLTVTDSTAPSVPTNLTATAVTTDQINLAWTASTDNVAVTGYKIFRNGVQINTSATNSFQDTGLNPSTTYSYTVSAYDAANNTSTLSNSASATTQSVPDSTPPSVPSGLSATPVSQTQINLAWTASTDNVGVTGYDIYRNGVLLTSINATSYSDTGLNPNTSYDYSVAAYDAAANHSTVSPSITATTFAPDTISPSIPTNLTKTSSTYTQISLSWTASTDNVRVSGYQVFRNNILVGTTTQTSYTDNGLSVNTSYNYTVTAYDAANNTSDPSLPLTASTNADTTPPTVAISSPVDGSTVSGSVSILTSNVSDDVGVAGVQFKLDGANLGAEDNTSPYSMIWDTTQSTPGAHILSAVARDTSGNTANSLAVNVTISSGPLSLTNAGPKSVVQGSSVNNTISATYNNPNGNGITYVSDSFTGANGSLSSHSADVGGNWTVTQGNLAIASNTLQAGGMFAEAIALNAATIPSDSDISMDINWNSCSSNTGNSIGILRTNTPGNPRIGTYEASYNLNSARWELKKYAGGNPSTLGTFAQACVVGQTHNLKLGKVGSSITLWVDGTTVVTATDSQITNTTNAGVVVSSAGTTNGLIGDNFLVASGPTPPSVSFTASGLPTGATASFTPASCLANCSTTITISTLSSTPTGTYAITVTGTAGASNNSTSFNLTVNPLPPDTTPPTVSITYPATGSTVGGSVNISANANDDRSVASVQFKVDGVNLGSPDTTNPYSALWNTTSLTDNTSHTLTATAVDGAGNSTTSATITVTVNNTVVPPPPTCGSLANPAFCETFEEGPSSTPSRGGDLDPTKWTVARLAPSDMSGNAGAVADPVAAGPIPACRSSFTQTTVYPPNDTLICDAGPNGLSRQLLTAAVVQNYGNNSYMITQPFDFANRTGKIDFDAEAGTLGSLGTYIELDITDDPVPAPTFQEYGNWEAGPIPKNGLMMKWVDTCALAAGTAINLSHTMVYNNYVGTILNPTFSLWGDPCPKTRAGSLNHVELRISQNHLDMYMSDFSTDNGQTFPNLRLAYSADMSLPFTRGYVHIAARNHASEKYGFGPDGYYHWDNIGFDGPVIVASKMYEIPNNTTITNNYNGHTMMNLGYQLQDGTGSKPAGIYDPSNRINSLQFQNVNISGATTAKLTMNAFYNNYHAPNTSMGWTYRFNGGTWRTRNFTASDITAFNASGSSGNILAQIDVPLTDLINGTNTFEILPLNLPMDYPPVVANINLVISN